MDALTSSRDGPSVILDITDAEFARLIGELKFMALGELAIADTFFAPPGDYFAWHQLRRERFLHDGREIAYCSIAVSQRNGDERVSGNHQSFSLERAARFEFIWRQQGMGVVARRELVRRQLFRDEIVAQLDEHPGHQPHLKVWCNAKEWTWLVGALNVKQDRIRPAPAWEFLGQFYPTPGDVNRFNGKYESSFTTLRFPHGT